MANRVDIVNAVYDILDGMDIFNKIYKEPTDIEKEKSFPIAWITLGSESIQDGDITNTCYMRVISLEITLGTKHRSTDQHMNELIDLVFDLIKDEYTLNGTVINLIPTDIMTDKGYFHPYALASINFKVWMR